MVKLVLSLFLLLPIASPSVEDSDNSFKGILITGENSLVLSGELNPLLLQDLAIRIKQSPEVEYLVISSIGGQIEGVELFAGVVSKAKNIQIIVIEASSAAAFIVQLANKHTIMAPNGSLMFHRGTYRFLNSGTAAEWAVRLSWMKENDARVGNFAMTRMNITRKQYDLNTLDKDWVLSPMEAVAVKAADRIARVKCDKSLRNKEIMMDVGEPLPINICAYLDRYQQP